MFVSPNNGLVPSLPGAVTQASKPRQVLFHNDFLISHSLPTSLFCHFLLKRAGSASSACQHHGQASGSPTAWRCCSPSLRRAVHGFAYLGSIWRWGDSDYPCRLQSFPECVAPDIFPLPKEATWGTVLFFPRCRTITKVIFQGDGLSRPMPPKWGEKGVWPFNYTPLAPSPHFPCHDGTYCLFKVSSAHSDDKHRKTADGGPTFTISWAKLLSAFPE